MRATSDEEREALARKIAKLRVEGVPWDGPGGIVESMRLVSSAVQGRKLLREYRLDSKQGGKVEIGESYDRYEIDPKTGQRKGYRKTAGRVSNRPEPGVVETVAERAGLTVRASANEQITSPTSRGDARHAPIDELVRRIRREMNAAVPDVNRDGPGIEADVLLVLRDPGRLGALITNYLSVSKNTDSTSANQRRLFAAAELPLEICLFWNAVPWDLDGRNPRSSDIEAGAGYLAELIPLMTGQPIVVACGNEAHKACARASVKAIEVCHPSNRGLRGGGVDREAAYLAGVKKATRLAKARAAQRT